ncbi:membrane protein [Micromonospora palomenae]
MYVFLTRGVIAIAWAAVFVAVSHSLTTDVTVGAGILLVLYPLIDAVASLIDARSQRGSARQLLLVNTGTSTIAAVALGVAATGSVASVFAAFGVWAVVSGAVQLVVALRRRAQLGNQWPLLLANGLSVIGGIAYLIAAAVGHWTLSMITLYTASGGIYFVIQAGLLARRRRRLANAAPS